jgi:short-subunit dehydrogenase
MMDGINRERALSNHRVLLITGASSGIGAATARLFAANGYRLVLAARRFDRLEHLAQEIHAAGGMALPISADVTQQDQIDALVLAAMERFQRIDLLLNNAGFGRLDWLEKLDPQVDIDAQLRVNLLGTVQTTRAVLPHMLAQRSGHVINMASLASFIATPTYSIYAASKFAMRGFTDALRREVQPMGIHVSGIYPGGVATEFSQHTGAHRKTGITTPARLKLSAEAVAAAVLRVARHPRRAVILPASMRWAVWLNTAFPGFVDLLIERRFTRPERGL